MVHSPNTSSKLRKSNSLDKVGKVRYGGGDFAPPIKSNHSEQQQEVKTSKIENKSIIALQKSGLQKVESASSSSSFEAEIQGNAAAGDNSSTNLDRDAITPNLQKHDINRNTYNGVGVVSMASGGPDSTTSLRTIYGDTLNRGDMPRSTSVSSVLTASTFEHIEIESAHGSNTSLNTMETLNYVHQDEDGTITSSDVLDAKNCDKESVMMRNPIDISGMTTRRVNSTSTLTNALKADSAHSVSSIASIASIGDVVPINGSVVKSDTVVTVGGNNGAFSSTNNSKIVVTHSSDEMDDHASPLASGHPTSIPKKKGVTKSKPIAIKAGSSESINRSSSSSAPADISISIEETSGEVASIMAHVGDGAILEESVKSGKSINSRSSDDYDYFDALLEAGDEDKESADASETDSVVIEGDARGESTVMDQGMGSMDMYDTNGAAIGSLTNSLELESWMLKSMSDSNAHNMR
jgi:hypothetical protein